MRTLLTRSALEPHCSTKSKAPGLHFMKETPAGFSIIQTKGDCRIMGSAGLVRLLGVPNKFGTRAFCAIFLMNFNYSTVS